MSAPLPANEEARLAALREYRILDTAEEQTYDDITALAASICRVPMATISLVDSERQWFKSKIGMKSRETSRDIAFCAHTILHAEPMIIRDALRDSRFSQSRLVRGIPHIRFYAGFPLTNPDGFHLGALCAIDRRPRRLNPAQQQAMRILSRHVIALMELRRVSARLAESLESIKTLHGMLPICAWCKRIRDDQGYWNQVETFIRTHTDANFTHGICPDCMDKFVTTDKIGKRRNKPG
jgi:GAF domain-containing protein